MTTPPAAPAPEDSLRETADMGLPRSTEIGVARDYGRIAARGIAFFVLVAAVSKVAAFGSQFALGWLMSEGDFAIYALAISMVGLVGVLRDGGLPRVLVQRGAEVGRLYRPVLQMALLFNVGAASALVLGAPLAVRIFDAPELPPLMWVLAGSLLLGTPSMFLRARLSIAMKFEAMAPISVASILVRHGSMVILAFLGFGPMSFVLPLLIIAVYEWIAFGRLAAKWTPTPASTPLTRPLFRDLFLASRWIMVGSFASMMINQGDYIVIGLMQKDLLGAYFFGFQLSVAVATLFSDNVRKVLMPTFVHMASDRERRGMAYLNSVRMFMFIVAPLCVGGAIVAPAAVDLLWAGRWNVSIPVVTIMLLSVIFRLLTPLSLAAMDSCGRWRLQCGLLIIDGVVTVLAAIAGAMLGSLLALAICIGIARSVMSVVQCVIAARIMGTPIDRMLLSVGGPVLLAGGAGVVAVVLVLGPAVTVPATAAALWIQTILVAAIFSLLFLLGSALFMRRRMNELVGRARTAMGKSEATK